MDKNPLPFPLPLQKGKIFVNRCPAQITNPCEFRNIQLPLFESGIMPKEDCGNAVGGYLRSADLLSICLGVRHSRAHTASYHGKLQLTEHLPAICRKASLIGSA